MEADEFNDLPELESNEMPDVSTVTEHTTVTEERDVDYTEETQSLTISYKELKVDELRKLVMSKNLHQEPKLLKKPELLKLLETNA